MDEKQFIRNFRAIGNGVIDVFLGAGASLSSGIATGNDFVWYLQKYELTADFTDKIFAKFWFYCSKLYFCDRKTRHRLRSAL